MPHYKCIRQIDFTHNNFKLVPIRYKDRYLIMNWRNQQLYHLRQDKHLTKTDQDFYFENIITKLFDEKFPNQILFSFLENDICVAYGGLVHINWNDKNAELSFVINTEKEKDNFELYWDVFLILIEDIAFSHLNLHKINTFAFDLRPHIYKIFENNGFVCEAILKEHCLFNNKFINVVIHSKLNKQ